MCIRDRATSLLLEGKVSIKRSELIAEIMQRFETLYEAFEKEQSLRFVQQRYNCLLYTSMRKAMTDRVILTGGLSHSAYFTRRLSEQIGKNVESTADGRYAGALGAAILAEEKSRRGR